MSGQIFLYLCLATAVSAFGAGNIPSYGALEGIAFRHGDIEDILLQLAMVPASSHFLQNFNPLSSAGKKFDSMSVKNVYFGNWLRDYSQAVDVGTLSKGLDKKTIRLLVWVMGFMAFGYATEEFEVTEARLGVYRPEEHIDNPMGYPSPEEPDARKFDSRLRGPVSSVELEIDPRTGMKNYIANESGGWMTSSAYVRNSLVRCIELGRMYKASGGDAEKYESLRILGQALHTLEDFSAHSNYCELTLVELGYRDVFCQVGTGTSLSLVGKRVYPLTTGTFGGLDFVHSLLGEATDKLSQTQISEVSSGLSTSSSQNSMGLLSNLQGLVGKIPGASSLNRDIDEMQSVSAEADRLRRDEQAGTRGFGDNLGASVNTDADDIARKIYPIMAFRDRLMKGLSAFFDKIPGLSALVDRISETLTVWVLSTIEPFMKPIVEKVTGGLGAGQALVTSGEAQLLVFENPQSSDPTHSMLAKDHFSCYLNQPAGLIGQAVVKHAVNRITAAWADTSINPIQIIDEILETFHHPAHATGRTGLQQEMRAVVQHWVERLGPKKQKVMQGLTMDGVRNGLHHEGGSMATTGVSANHSHAHDGRPLGPVRQNQQIHTDSYAGSNAQHSTYNNVSDPQTYGSHGKHDPHRPHPQTFSGHTGSGHLSNDTAHQGGHPNSDHHRPHVERPHHQEQSFGNSHGSQTEMYSQMGQHSTYDHGNQGQQGSMMHGRLDSFDTHQNFSQPQQQGYGQGPPQNFGPQSYGGSQPYPNNQPPQAYSQFQNNPAVGMQQFAYANPGAGAEFSQGEYPPQPYQSAQYPSQQYGDSGDWTRRQ